MARIAKIDYFELATILLEIKGKLDNTKGYCVIVAAKDRYFLDLHEGGDCFDGCTLKDAYSGRKLVAFLMEEIKAAVVDKNDCVSIAKILK